MPCLTTVVRSSAEQLWGHVATLPRLLQRHPCALGCLSTVCLPNVLGPEHENGSVSFPCCALSPSHTICFARCVCVFFVIAAQHTLHQLRLSQHTASNFPLIDLFLCFTPH